MQLYLKLTLTLYKGTDDSSKSVISIAIKPNTYIYREIYTAKESLTFQP